MQTVQTVAEVQFEQLLGHWMQLLEIKENPVMQPVQTDKEVQDEQFTLHAPATATPV